MHIDGGTRIVPKAAGTEDASILKAYRRGEREALRVVESWIRSGVGRSKPEILRERADVVQEVHLRILTNLHRGSFRGESTFKTYVWGIARYTSLTILRDRKKRRPVVMEPEELPARQMRPDEALFASERVARLATELRRLSAKERRLYQLLYGQGLDYRTVGRTLGIPVGTVKSRASRFRSALTRRVAGSPPPSRFATTALGAVGRSPRDRPRVGSEA